MITGPCGEAAMFDLAAIAAKYPRPHSSLVSWRIKAPWANPMWHSYALHLIHLRPVDGLKPPVIYVKGATHEIMLAALDPREDQPLDDVPKMLMPVNFGAQFFAEDDDTALDVVAKCVNDIIHGLLSPDTDYTQSWIKRFGAGMLKGDPARAGETVIVMKQGDKVTQIVHDPKDADAVPQARRIS